jgi:hypothetical protein
VISETKAFNSYFEYPTQYRMKRIIGALKKFSWEILAVLFVFIAFMTTGIPWTFVYVEIGRFAGPIWGIVVAVLAMLGMTICIAVVACSISIRFGKTRLRWRVVFSAIISIIVLSSFSLVFLQKVSQEGEKIDQFVTENTSSNFESYIANVSSFLGANVQNAWKKSEGVFKIDYFIYNVYPLGSFVMGILRASRTELILYQGWGTCGQAAIVIEDLLLRGGYEARQGIFKDYSHQWAEVKYNGTWWIVDPWWLTPNYLIEIQHLRGLQTQFADLSGVWVTYRNGTVVDSSSEHGY